MMTGKLGLQTFQPTTDIPLFEQLDEVLLLTETDMTLFYRLLADVQPDDPDPLGGLREAYYAPNELDGEVGRRVDAWLAAYLARVREEGVDPERRRSAMNRVNPKFVLRNYLAQLAIDAAEQGDFAMIHQLQDVLRTPYDEHPEHADWAGKRPDWARDRVGCSMLSCSS
jgi:serine/tyrosine/threonine adenylyltransferase